MVATGPRPPASSRSTGATFITWPGGWASSEVEPSGDGWSSSLVEDIRSRVTLPLSAPCKRLHGEADRREVPVGLEAHLAVAHRQRIEVPFPAVSKPGRKGLRVHSRRQREDH